MSFKNDCQNARNKITQRETDLKRHLSDAEVKDLLSKDTPWSKEKIGRVMTAVWGREAA